MKLKKEEILFVSSNSFDVIGAKSFGFRVCWINRTGATLDPLGPKPDLLVSSSEELSQSLEGPALLDMSRMRAARPGH